jgi:hypothetical protein
MPSYWDNDYGQSYDFTPADFSGGMDDWLEKERKRKEEEERLGHGVEAPPPELPQMSPMQEEDPVDMRPPIVKGIQDVGQSAWDAIKSVAKVC